MDLYESYVKEYQKLESRSVKMESDMLDRAHFELQRNAASITLSDDELIRYKKNPARFIASGQRELTTRQVEVFHKAIKERVGYIESKLENAIEKKMTKRTIREWEKKLEALKGIGRKQIREMGKGAASAYQRASGKNISSYIQSLYASEEAS